MSYVPILCYHRVCEKNAREASSASLCVSPKQFYNQLRLLKFLGYQTISPQTLVAARLGQKNLPKKPVLLTFDDGYADNYTHAWPILKRFNFSATIFLVTRQLGDKNNWDPNGAALLTKKQVIEMAESGIDFGSHTASHIDMSCAQQEIIENELKESFDLLKNLTRRMDISFCYPYARTNAKSIQLTQKAAYICAFAGDLGYDLSQDHLFNLMRIQVFPSTSLFQFWKKVQPWFPTWAQIQKTKNKKPF